MGGRALVIRTPHTPHLSSLIIARYEQRVSAGDHECQSESMTGCLWRHCQWQNANDNVKMCLKQVTQVIHTCVLTVYMSRDDDDVVAMTHTSYDRQDGKGCRKGWTEKGVAHLASIAPGGSFFASNPCEEKQRIAALRACPRGCMGLGANRSSASFNAEI
eukprot:scaffold3058_cov134-Isochrysis_galbana.AAC.3